MAKMESMFDMKAFTFPADTAREKLIQMSRAAENAERYEDMCMFMTQLVTENDKPSVEERNLLSVAFKNVIGNRRASWRTLKSALEPQGRQSSTDAETQQDANTNVYLQQVEEEIKDACGAVIALLTNTLIKQGENSEAQVFFLKMAGDYYRYLAESISVPEHKNKTKEYYQQAMDMAVKELQATNPIRLGLALNYSVCKYEILKNREEACAMAKEAFDAAISELDKLQEEDYKDSTLIMQLLRDNLTLWTSTGEDEGNDNEGGDAGQEN